MTTKTWAELEPGDVFFFDRVERDLTVVSVEPTGSVKFGEAGPDATPIVRVYVDGMPKPFGAWVEAAGDQLVAVTSGS